tara:strand:+ start:902 stop:1468 length:567 start_codon:yes stop_codon:yes gene_type:complete
MRTNNLKAWVRYAQNKVVPSSLILQANKPKVGVWKEISTDLCCDTNPCIPTNYYPWTIVTGGIAGDGTVLKDNGGTNNIFTIIGPDDADDEGWVYLKQYFPTGAIFDINYKWTSFDDFGPVPPALDLPVYWNSATEPTGIPADITPKVGSTPDSGTWNITVPAGEWFAVGIYSSDSCCGRGFLAVTFI